MAEAQYGPTNVTACGAELDYHPKSSEIARRSISIFSRRGTATPPEPEPPLPFMAQAMARTSSKLLTKRQKNWIRRQGAEAKKSQGTVLHAVLPAEMVRMTALEEEMARGPNEEIMSAISERSQTQHTVIAGPRQASPTQLASSSAYPTGLWNGSSASPSKRTDSQRKRDTNARIGVWVDGVVRWDDAARPLEYTPSSGLAPLPISDGASRSTFCRPSLSVVIPSPRHLSNTVAVHRGIQPQFQEPPVSMAPANNVSKFVSTPANCVEGDIVRHESLLASDTTSAPIEPIVLVERNSTPVFDIEAPKGTRTASSTSASSSLIERDDASTYSKRSSATSMEAAPLLQDHLKTPHPMSLHAHDFAVANPADVGVFDDVEGIAIDVNKPLPRVPERAPSRPAPAAPLNLANIRNRRTWSSDTTKSAPGGRNGDIKLRSSMPRTTRSSTLSLSQLDQVDAEFMRTSPYCRDTFEPYSISESPTLSQAEKDLAAHLSTLPSQAKKEAAKHEEEITISRSTSIRRADSVRSVMQPPSRAPTVPRRSRKRDWSKTPRAKHIAAQVAPQTLKAKSRRRSESNLQQAGQAPKINGTLSRSQLRKSSSAVALPQMFLFAQHMRMPSAKRQSVVEPLPEPRAFVIDDGLCPISGPVVLRVITQDDEEYAANCTAAAEDVLLRILSALRSLDDLSNTAIVNKGMYRVYKENELHLIKTVIYNQSPAAWEYREWCPPTRDLECDANSKASSQLEHSPTTYLRTYKRDSTVVEQLKGLVLERCQTFIRPETAHALADANHPDAQRYTDAFWRIWAFCTIFGSQKGREDDITGQLDWLKGGLLANNQGCVATMNTNLDFDMGSVLLNPPEHFSQGNESGLTATQLYDMTEIWTCMAVLLQGFQGRVDQASRNGVFENCGVDEGDFEAEERMLEEWIAYLLTLGPAVVLELALASGSSTAGFALARENGWTSWSPPMFNNSRSQFLREPVSKLYEERIAAAAYEMYNPSEQEKKELSRKRVANLALEIKLRRQTSSYKRSPFIDQTQERPMSMVSLSRHSSASSARTSISIRRSNHVSMPPQQVSYPPLSHSSQSASASSAFSPVSVMSAMVSPSKPMSPTNAWSPRRIISPILEDRVETYNRLSLANLGGMADSTAERAVQKIVEMGWDEVQAKKALKMTDMGDGLRVDKAVDLLLRAR